MRFVDGRVAGGWVYPRLSAGGHGGLRCAVGAVEAGPEDATVSAFVVAVGADGVNEDVGGGSGSAPEVGEVA